MGKKKKGGWYKERTKAKKNAPGTPEGKGGGEGKFHKKQKEHWTKGKIQKKKRGVKLAIPPLFFKSCKGITWEDL